MISKKKFPVPTCFACIFLLSMLLPRTIIKFFGEEVSNVMLLSR